jgi:hypothetical protein
LGIGATRPRGGRYGTPTATVRQSCGWRRASPDIASPASAHQPQEEAIPTYIIEREIPGAGQLSDDELRGITTTSNEAAASLSRAYTWCYSFVAGDKIYCVHQAEEADDVREHARRGGFPATLIAEVARVFDSTGPRELPV